MVDATLPSRSAAQASGTPSMTLRLQALALEQSLLVSSVKFQQSPFKLVPLLIRVLARQLEAGEPLADDPVKISKAVMNELVGISGRLDTIRHQAPLDASEIKSKFAPILAILKMKHFSVQETQDGIILMLPQDRGNRIWGDIASHILALLPFDVLRGLVSSSYWQSLLERTIDGKLLQQHATPVIRDRQPFLEVNLVGVFNDIWKLIEELRLIREWLKYELPEISEMKRRFPTASRLVLYDPFGELSDKDSQQALGDWLRLMEKHLPKYTEILNGIVLEDPEAPVEFSGVDHRYGLIRFGHRLNRKTDEQYGERRGVNPITILTHEFGHLLMAHLPQAAIDEYRGFFPEGSALRISYYPEVFAEDFMSLVHYKAPIQLFRSTPGAAFVSLANTAEKRRQFFEKYVFQRWGASQTPSIERSLTDTSSAASPLGETEKPAAASPAEPSAYSPLDIQIAKFEVPEYAEETFRNYRLTYPDRWSPAVDKYGHYDSRFATFHAFICSVVLLVDARGESFWLGHFSRNDEKPNSLENYGKFKVFLDEIKQQRKIEGATENKFKLYLFGNGIAKNDDSEKAVKFKEWLVEQLAFAGIIERDSAGAPRYQDLTATEKGQYLSGIIVDLKKDNDPNRKEIVYYYARGTIEVSPAVGDESAASPVNQETNALDPSLRSESTPVANEELGGIDFRGLPIVTQPMGSSPLGIPRLRSGLPSVAVPININLDKEWQEIENMLQAGITPSNQRIKEYLEVSCQTQDCSQRIDKVLSLLADILRLEEEQVTSTEPALKEFLVLLEADKSTQELRVALSNISVLPKEPKLVTP